MKCEDVLLQLDGREPSAELAAHLEACPECRSAADVLALAALPRVSRAEQAQLDGLAGSTLAAWRRHEAPRGAQRRWWVEATRLALAAGLGALVASGAHALRAGSTTSTTMGSRPYDLEAVALEVPTLTDLDGDEFNLSDDEVFFEVSWPQATEGEL